MNELKKILDLITLPETAEQLPYSILPMMYDRISSKELLHSQIIASLLDPNGKHDLGDVPLSLFLNRINLSTFGEDLSQTKVEIEKGVDNMRRIDILLTNGNNAIIIENKLNNAVDQPDQLKDYLSSISEREYTNITIVYLPLYAYKTTNEAVKVVNLYPQGLIEWLVECNSPLCDNYINLLKYMNQSNRNFMEAKKILAELSAEQIEKLVAVAAIVNGSDWYMARFEPIKAGVQEQMLNININISVKSNRLSLWLPEYDDFWVDVYAKDTYCDLYVVDYKVHNNDDLPDKLANTSYVYDSVECSKRYFKQKKNYHFSPQGNQKLISDIVELLELSKK